MTSPVDLRPDHLEIVQGILREHLPVGVKVWVFGSRASWSAKDSSDLDLALEGEARLSHKVLGALKDAFEDSALPYTVDVVDLNRIADSFRQIVESQRSLLAIDRDGAGQRVRLAVSPTGGAVSGEAALTVAAGQWREVTLGDVCDFRAGSAFKLQYQGRTTGDYPFIKVSDMNHPANGVRIRESANWVSAVIAKEIKAKPLPEGSIIFAKIGEALRQNRLRMIVRPTIVDNNMMGAIPKGDIVDPQFLFYGMHQFDMGELASGTALPYLTVSTLADLPLSLPPLSVQRAIAYVLGTLDDKIELNRRMNETLEAMARALFKSWFVDFDPVRAKAEGRWQRGESLPGLPADLYDLFPDRLVPSELGEIPKGWHVKAMGELCSLRAGSVFRKASQGKPLGKYPFIKVSDMNLAANSVGILVANNWIDEGDLIQLKAKPFPSDTTVFAKIGEGLKQNRIRILLRPTLIDNNMMAAVPNADAIDPLILFYALSQFDFGEVAVGTALPYLTASSLNSLTVPMPRLEEQIPLAEPLRFMHRRHIANEIESHTLTAQRDVLLLRIVSGDLKLTIVNQSLLDADEQW